MTWFAISALVSIRKVQEPNGPWLVYENVILIESADSEKACKAAEERTREGIEIDDNITIDGEPAVQTFEGVRKAITVSNPHPLSLNQDRPTSGTEITYSLFKVEDIDSLKKLAAGSAVIVSYQE